jgi:CheY-like chemotaxis protein
MVYGFVKQSGGHMKIESEVGYGTSVKLYLPQTGADQAATHATASDEGTSAADDQVVLVVEDDAPVRRLQIRFLQFMGYITLEAEDGATALAIIENAPNVNVLLTDLIMPGGMSGTELYRQARSLMPELKVIFMSGYATKAIIEDEQLQGFPMLTKPFTREALAEAMQRALLQEEDTSLNPDS